MTDSMNVKQWHEQQFLPWKQAVAKVLDDRAAQQQALYQNMGQLQAVVALLLDGKAKQAVMAWNTLQLHPALREVAVLQDGESIRLVETSGRARVLKVDDLLADLQRLLDERAAQQNL